MCDFFHRAVLTLSELLHWAGQNLPINGTHPDRQEEAV